MFSYLESYSDGMNKEGRRIRTETISYSYPVETEAEEELISADLKALDQVSLDVEAGQFICILGSNGSGKSTLARHLNALLVPDEGSVWIGDMDTRDDRYLWEIRAQVGMVFQNPDNQMVASQIEEEVAFGLENIGFPSADMEQRVKEALESVGLSGLEKENPANLSGGQKQRTAVAGILAMRPACIVLDESTAMLDPKGRREIMNTVLELNRKHGITIICITHFMEEAVHADRVFVMHKGKLLLSGTPEEVFCKSAEIREAGLKLPVICQIAEELRRKGMKIPASVITEKQLIACLTGVSENGYPNTSDS
ncbi:MAG: energy-coupling factor transporter ATPase [Parasporobacterium sp.]|nr:energy-coupling factor transporter ATPase [Parasporobacterium sp.]